MYRVISDRRVSPVARRLAVVVDQAAARAGQERAGATDPLSAIDSRRPARLVWACQVVAERELKTSERLVIYVYADRVSVRWHGWIARVTARQGQPPAISTDNDPELRRQLFEAFH